MARQDPFYELKVEIDASVNELTQKMTRYHGLSAGNPERKTLSAQVDAGAESIRWQLEELAGAVDRAAGNPAKFNLTPEELSTRRRWIDNTNTQVGSFQDSLRGTSKVGASGTAGVPPGVMDSSADAAHSHFVGGESERQSLIMRQQDEHLEDIEQAVGRIGDLGRTIGEELDGQQRLLSDMGEEMDTTYSRMRAAQKRMADVIRASSGGHSQLCIIIVLVIVLIVLIAIALS